MTNTFLQNYDIFTSGNESPRTYHQFAALSVLSAIVGRKLWVDQGISTIYPNLYIVFVGEPGNGKSVAMSLARRMVRAFDHISIAPSSITVERITQRMGAATENQHQQVFEIGGKVHTYTQFSFFANELATLLGANGEKVIKFFTDIYDEEVFEVDTKHQGADNILAPYITLLACMTPEFTGVMLKEKVLSSGFARRAIFINSFERGPAVPRPVITDEQKEAWRQCIERGHKIKTLKGQFTWDKSAEEFFDDWYIKKYNKLRTGVDVATRSYIRTKDVLLLKIAMLLSVSEGFEKRITTPLLQAGVTLLDSIEPKIGRVFEGTGRNPIADIASKILTLLETSAKGFLPEKQIVASMYAHGNADEITQALLFLTKTDKIEVRELKRGDVPVGQVIALRSSSPTASVGTATKTPSAVTADPLQTPPAPSTSPDDLNA